MLDTSWVDRASEIVGGIEGGADLAEAVAPEWLGPGAELLGGGLDIMKGIEGIGEGEYFDGVTDLVKGIGGSAKGGLGEDAPAWLDVVTGGADVVHGVADIATDEGYGGQTLDGIHDILSGGSDVVAGLASKNPQLRAIAEGFGAGMKVGDAIAPYVFHDAATEGAQTQAIPEHGFRAGTGNPMIDGLLHGADDLGNGDYASAGQNLSTGISGAAQFAIDPVGAIATQALGGAISSLWE